MPTSGLPTTGKTIFMEDDMEIFAIAIVAGIIGLLFALYLTMKILREDQGNERVQFIGQAIREGAAAF